jgi:hypothetical protein
MVQNASPTSAQTDPSVALTGDRGESGRFLVNSYADRLMDDLFQDVEQLIDPGRTRAHPEQSSPVQARRSRPNQSQPPEALESSQSEDLALDTLESDPETPPGLGESSNHALVQRLSSPPQSSARESYDLGANLDTPLVPISDLAIHDQFGTQDWSASALGNGYPLAHPPRSTPSSFDRLLLGVGCISVVISMALWLVYQEAHRQRPTLAPVAQSAAAEERTNQFAEYAQKTLDKLSQSSQPPGTSQAPNTTGQQPPASTVTIPAQPPAAPMLSPRVSTGLERIYVPSYQFPPSSPSPSVLITPLPAAPKTNPSLRPNGLATKPTNSLAAPASPSTSAGVVRRLAGVLNQGDRSVALFEVNGITQRFEIGESIGSSGWSLVEVAQNQAMIRRNGEVRSVYVGQSF